MVRSKYWWRYVLEGNAEEIDAQLKLLPFSSEGTPCELLHFALASTQPALVISPGSAGHAYVFAELGYRIRQRGYNVFIMPRHGGLTISQLIQRHEHALQAIRQVCNGPIGMFGEGLGGYVTFYLALAGAPLESIVCQNAPALLTEQAFHDAVFTDMGALRRRMLLPMAKLLRRVAPRTPLPISSYLDFKQLVDSAPESHAREVALVEHYLKDPDFDQTYPVSAIMSLLETPPPRDLSALTTPTMFIVPRRGLFSAYEKDLFSRLPVVRKELVEVDGSVFWMVSHPMEAAELISGWCEARPTNQLRPSHEPNARSRP